MQAVKDKLSDMKAVRNAKAEARAEEKAEKQLAKARVDIAREVRMAKEAEAEMDLHVSKASDKAMKEVARYETNTGSATTTTAAGVAAATAANGPPSGPPNAASFNNFL